MSWSVNKDTMTIKMTKGDSAIFKIACNVMTDEGSVVPYEPVENDHFIFAMKEQDDRRPIIKKEIPKDTMILMLDEEDTKDLDYGTYVWEVSVNNEESGYHDTFIDNKKLVLTYEVY